MKRSQRNRRVSEESASLDISSLIDVCFLLLIYFIVTTTIQAAERDLALSMPSDQLEQPSETKSIPLLIKVNGRGDVFVGDSTDVELLDSGDERELPLLSQRLQILKANADLLNLIPAVQLSVNSDVKQQRVIDCLNTLSKHKINAVTFTDSVD